MSRQCCEKFYCRSTRNRAETIANAQQQAGISFARRRVVCPRDRLRKRLELRAPAARVLVAAHVRTRCDLRRGRRRRLRPKLCPLNDDLRGVVLAGICRQPRRLRASGQPQGAASEAGGGEAVETAHAEWITCSAVTGTGCPANVFQLVI